MLPLHAIEATDPVHRWQLNCLLVDLTQVVLIEGEIHAAGVIIEASEAPVKIILAWMVNLIKETSSSAAENIPATVIGRSLLTFSADVVDESWIEAALESML